MQVMRRQWIGEGKPTRSAMEGTETQDMGTDGDVRPRNGSLPSSEQPNPERARPRTPTTPVGEEQNIYDVTPGVVRAAAPAATESRDNLFLSDDECPDQPEDDELDALLLEDAIANDGSVNRDGSSNIAGHTASKLQAPEEDNFDDEMEVMADMDDLW